MIAREIRAQVLSIATAYRRATGLSLATVSARFYGNAGFLAEFKAGRQTISLDKLDEMLEKFKAVWPENAELPYLGPIFLDNPGISLRKDRATHSNAVTNRG